MEADGLWKAALRSARLSTALGKRRVRLGVSHSSHSPRQRRAPIPEALQRPARPPLLHLYKPLADLTPHTANSVLDVPG